MAVTQGRGATLDANQGFASNVSRVQTTTNYTNIIDFASATSQPFLPETLDKKVKRFGNRSISGFLSKMAAEYALQSDEIRWTEDNRLHLKASTIALTSTSRSAGLFNFPTGHGFRVGQTVILVRGGSTAFAGNEVKAAITAIGSDDTDVTLVSYTAEDSSDGGFGALGPVSDTTANITAIIYGSEFQKGSEGMVGSLETSYVDRENNPIILKDKYSVSGSDVAQIGWIEVSDVNGDGGHGYLWYLQSEMDQRARFMDYVETALLEAVPAAGTPAADATAPGTNGAGGNLRGSRGLFYELDSYGATFTGGFAAGAAQGAGIAGLNDFDQIITQLDTQGNIEENTFYLNRTLSLQFDNFLGNQSNLSGANAGGGPSWGSFSNSKDMALNLGFSGIRRGEYDFYKTSWKYLNDEQGRRDFAGSTGASTNQSGVLGIMCPMGSSSVYDEMLSKTVTRPYMHIRYRAAQGENRKLKNWVTGSVGGVYTSDADRMDVHYLSERCLVVQAANNFGIFKTV